MQSCEATDCKPHRQGRAMLLAMVDDRWQMAAKPTVTRLAGRAGPEARPFARHKQSTGLFVSGLSLR